MENSSDPEVLKQIAETTGGQFYQADSENRLREIYNDIDKLEKTKLKVLNYNKKYEAYQIFAWVAFFCFLAELLLRITWFRRIP